MSNETKNRYKIYFLFISKVIYYGLFRVRVEVQ